MLNNLTNISFLPEYATLCGITEQEIGDNFGPELQRMAEVNEWTLQQTHENLKDYYDGYHFSRRNMTDIYNPFSLINALDTQDLSNFWAASGATSMLPKFVDNLEISLEQFDHCYIVTYTKTNIPRLMGRVGGYLFYSPFNLSSTNKTMPLHHSSS